MVVGVGVTSSVRANTKLKMVTFSEADDITGKRGKVTSFKEKVNAADDVDDCVAFVNIEGTKDYCIIFGGTEKHREKNKNNSNTIQSYNIRVFLFNLDCCCFYSNLCFNKDKLLSRRKEAVAVVAA